MRCWLKKARKEKGITMADMAKTLGISEGYYSLIESGKRQEKMDITLLVRISSALGIQLVDAASRECALLPSAPPPTSGPEGGPTPVGCPAP